ncbi:hypothetical protein HDU82_007740 [Entophlyctis luteolus]|nr:hypothetical protein HDU82_007740 [Entophlyctis luteolus]
MLIQTSPNPPPTALPPDSKNFPAAETAGAQSFKGAPAVLHRLQSSSATLSSACLCGASDSPALPVHPPIPSFELAENSSFMQSLRDAHSVTPVFSRRQSAGVSPASRKVTFELNPSAVNLPSLPAKVAAETDKKYQPAAADCNVLPRRNSAEANEVRSHRLVETWLRSGTISSVDCFAFENGQKQPPTLQLSNITSAGSIQEPPRSNTVENTVPRRPAPIVKQAAAYPDSQVYLKNSTITAIARQESFADTESGASDDEEFAQLQRALELSLKEARERPPEVATACYNMDENDHDYDDDDTGMYDDDAWNNADEYDEEEALAMAIEESRREFEERERQIANCGCSSATMCNDLDLDALEHPQNWKGKEKMVV